MLGPAATQNDVYRKVEDVVLQTTEGINACVMAYGQTGAGKTHTMLGDNDGIIPKALNALFDKLGSDEPPTPVAQTPAPRAAKVSVSLLQILGEKLEDLLSPNSELPLRVRQASRVNDELYVSGLSSIVVDDAEAARWYMRAADSGDADAQAELGAMYKEGRGVEKDDEKALDYFMTAADAGSQATPQDFGDDGSLGSVPRGGFISATPLGRGKREVRIPTDGASVTSFDTALSPDRQTSLVSGLETLSLEAPSVTFVGTKRRHVAGAMTNTHAVRMPGASAASPARSDGLGPELSIDRFSHTGSDILSQEEGLGNLHNPSYSETGDLFVGNRWSGQGHDGGACGTLVGGGGYPTDVYRV